MASVTAHNAALTGSLAGMMSNRWPADAAHAASAIAASHTFANEVDAHGGYGALGAGKEALLLFAVSQGLLAGRAPQSTTAADYHDMATLANAIYAAAVGSLD